MQELVKDVFTAPLGTIFVLAGVLFLLIAVVGKVSGKIEPGPKERALAGMLGSAFITIGLAMYWWSLPASTVPPSLEKTKIVDKEITPPSQPPGKESGRQKGDTSSSPDSATHQLPDWVPLYPGAKIENLSIKMRDGGGQYGRFFFISDEYYDTVLRFYQTNLEMKKWEVKTKYGALSATNEGGGQSIVVTSGSAIRPYKYFVTFEESH